MSIPVLSVSWVLRTGCLIATLMLLTGCGKNEEMASQTVLVLSASETDGSIDSKEAVRNTSTVYDSQPESPDSIVIGLDADMTSGSARSGEAIRRGIVIALEEINERGGVLGRPLELVVRDHRGNPARGIDNIHEFAAMDRVIAVVGGIHTPVALQELPAIHQHELIYLGPWAAGTPVVDNGYSPNFVFRVSVRDEFAGGFLVGEAQKRGARQIGLLLEQTGWGRSNEQAIKAAARLHGLEISDVQWFHWGVGDLDREVNSLGEAQSDVIVLVANPLEGVTCVKSMLRRAPAERIPVISHWGITAGEFFKQCPPEMLKLDLVFLQTYSFVRPPKPHRANGFIDRYCRRFEDCGTARDIFSPVGTAHAYDLIHIFCQAIRDAGTTESGGVRESLENLTEYDGLVRTYSPAFTTDRHDALSADDFTLARYDQDGAIIPVTYE